MSRGIVLFGVNNARVDYVQLAIMCASFIKKNMPGTSVCLITDQGSKDYHAGLGQSNLQNYFEHVILLEEKEAQFVNNRAYRDTKYYHVDAQFKNETRSSVYDLSPYDETLLVDCDYLICNNVLSNVWGSVDEIMMNKQAINLLHEPLQGTEFRLNTFGIKMYWATLIYFKKGKKAKLLFELVQHIKDNWEFYKLTYDFPGHLFRNDYAFSIALHILNGFVETDDYAAPLPDDTILTSLDIDQFFKISAPDDISMFVQDPKESWKFYVSRLKGLNVHIMNKLSLLNHMGSIMEVLK